MPWFGSPRPGQHWAEAWADRMGALEGAADLQHRKMEKVSLKDTQTPLLRPARRASPQEQPSPVAINRVWAEYNVQEGNRKGLRLHVDFVATGMPGRTGSVAAYFYVAPGGLLEDTNGRYRSATGRVSVAAAFTPAHSRTRYNDFSLFMPYAELHLAPGIHNVRWLLIIWDDQGRKLTSSQAVQFVLRGQ